MATSVSLNDALMNQVDINYLENSEEFIISIHRTECGIDSSMNCCINAQELKEAIARLERENGEET